MGCHRHARRERHRRRGPLVGDESQLDQHARLPRPKLPPTVLGAPKQGKSTAAPAPVAHHVTQSIINEALKTPGAKFVEIQPDGSLKVRPARAMADDLVRELHRIREAPPWWRDLLAKLRAMPIGRLPAVVAAIEGR